MDHRIIKTLNMKLPNIKKLKFILIYIFLLSNQIIVANNADPLDFEDNIQDVPAPIDLWVIPMLCLGIAMLFYFSNRKVQSK